MKEREDKTNLQTEREELATLLGVAASETIDKIKEQSAKDIKLQSSFGTAKLSEKEQNYRKLVQLLIMTILKKDADNASLTNQLAELKRTTAAEIAKKEGQVQQYSKEKDQAIADLNSEREKHKNELVALGVSKTALEEQKNKLNTDLSAQGEKLSGEIKNLQGEYQKRDRVANEATDTIKKLNATTFEVPDGKVMMVNGRYGTVSVNLGAIDGLRPRTMFAVYNPNTNDVSRGQKKGSIEITGVTDGHSADARVVDQDPANPILPGDIIYSPIWHVGRQEHFAVAGFVDMDKDGTSDMQRVRDLIRVQGGKIDAEVDAEGKVVGQMRVGTRFLILGDAPLNDSKQREAYSKMFNEAHKLGVETLSVEKFLDHVGYTIHSSGKITREGVENPDHKRRPAGADEDPKEQLKKSFTSPQPDATPQPKAAPSVPTNGGTSAAGSGATAATSAPAPTPKSPTTPPATTAAPTKGAATPTVNPTGSSPADDLFK